MRKKITISIFLLSILFFLAFGNVAKAQTPSYLGVNEGDEYKWKVEITFDGVDTLVSNIRDIMVDQQNKLNELVLFGFEDLTINETIESIAHTYLANILPTGWETYNLSTLVEETIKEYVVKFNSTIFSGMIPSNWQSLNLSTFYDYMVDGIYDSTGVGFEDNPIPELIELMINELNSSVLFGLIPEGWEDLTIEQFYLSLLEIDVPGIHESFMLSEAWQLMVPSEFSGVSIEALLNTIFEPMGLNATFLFEQFFLGLNSTLPPGMESEPMSVVIDYLNFVINSTLINSTLPDGYDSLPVATLLDIATDQFVYYGMPAELHGLTLVEIISLGIDNLIFLYDSQVLPLWGQTKLMLQASGLLNYEIGIKMTVDNIGIVESVFPGGPQGVNLDVTLYYSLDFENWVDLSLLFTGLATAQPMIEVIGIFGIIPLINFFAGETMVFDPSSYSDVDVAIMDQLMYSGGLIVANNYDWASIQTNFTVETASNPHCIEASIAWNSNGLLSTATIEASGDEVATIKLLGGRDEIPGYGIPIVFGLTTLTIIGVIIYIKRKNNI